MRVYFTTPQTERDYEMVEAARLFFRWITREDSADFVDFLRKFVGVSEEFGGLGGTVESDDDLTELSELITEVMADTFLGE